MVDAAREPGVGGTSLPALTARAKGVAGAAGWGAFLGATLLILFGPLLVLALFSFNDSEILAFPLEGFTTRWYSRALQDTELRTALLNSLMVALVVAPGSVVLGTLTAFGLTRFRFRLRALVGGMVGAPLILPWLVIGIAALLFYGRINVDLSLRTVTGTQLIATFPLVTAIVAAQLFRFERVQEEAAVDLGCSRLQVLRYVILPHIAPALAASAIFAFTSSFNNFEISFFTIGFQQTFPVWVFSSVRDPLHLPSVNAISTVISAGQLLILYLGVRLLRARGGALAPGLAARQVEEG